MSIPQITFGRTSRSSAAYVTPVADTYQTRRREAHTASPAYSIELSHPAQAKSLKLSGYPDYLISIKLGLDVQTVREYLDITAREKSTYLVPKQAGSSPGGFAEARSQLTLGFYS